MKDILYEIIYNILSIYFKLPPLHDYIEIFVFNIIKLVLLHFYYGSKLFKYELITQQ